jgi:hypothetical protein
MHDSCPTCGLHFNREPGYFLGAMYISYGLALAFIFVLGAALWALTGWRLDKIAIWAVLLFLPFAPTLTFLSRVLWIYLDQKIDPEPFYEVLQSMNTEHSCTRWRWLVKHAHYTNDRVLGVNAS